MLEAEDRVKGHFRDSAELLHGAMETLAPAVARAGRLIAECLAAGGKVLACGNGGSASDAQHFASELVNRFERERRGLAAIALTGDGPTITSIANDEAYERIFARQVEALGRPGDVLLAVTTSGASANVNAAARSARKAGIAVVALSGAGGGSLAGLLADTDVEIRVPAGRTARIQEVHGVVIHCLCDLVEHGLFGDSGEPG